MKLHRVVVSKTFGGWGRWAISLLAACGVGSGPISSSAGEAVPPERFIHPLWLDTVVFTDGVPRFVCDPELAKMPIEEMESSLGKGLFISSEYPQPDEYYAGFVGYREAARWTGSNDGAEFALLEITMNGGGTGYFSSLAKVKKRGPTDFEVLWRLNAGDRCNDGRLSVIDLSGDRVTYSTSATPFRLLNPVDQSNWRMLSLLQRLPASARDVPETLFGWEPYSDVANSALSCAGKIVRRYDPISGKTEVLGVALDTEDFLSESQGKMQACINEWLRERMPELKQGDDGWIPLEEWIAGFESLSDLCVP